MSTGTQSRAQMMRGVRGRNTSQDNMQRREVQDILMPWLLPLHDDVHHVHCCDPLSVVLAVDNDRAV